MRVRRVSAWLGASAIAVAAVTVILAQQTMPQFKSGVSLLRLDASVVDDSGRAIGDLKPEDFQVSIDGQPRTVQFARFTGADASSRGSGGPSPSGISSYARNTQTAGGRAIVVMVDLDSIRAGSERSLLETAAALIDNLRPIVTGIDDTQYSVTWMRGTYSSYTNYNTSVVGIIASVPEPTMLGGLVLGALALLRRTRQIGRARHPLC